jgi:site-specific recombinase XerD
MGMAAMMETGMTPPNKDRRYPAEVLEAAEVQALLDQLSSKSKSGIRNRALVVFLYRSGLRVSEICNLTPADVNLAGHSVRVRLGKGAKTTTRGFHPNATDALARWIDTRKAMGFRNGPLFCTHQGGPVSDQYVRNLLHQLAAKAELGKRVHPHGLRHSYAVSLERAGLTVTEISKLLGHSSISVTARYLDHLTNGAAIEALERADLPELAA